MAAVDISPATALHRRARYAPAVPALHYKGATVTAGELGDRVRRLAAGLAGAGLRRGDRVAYLGLNSPALLETLLAAAQLGAVFVPVNFRLAPDEVRHVLVDSGAHTVVAEEGHRAVVEDVRAEVPVRRYVLVDTDPASPVTGGVPAPWTPLSALLGEPTRDLGGLNDCGEPGEPGESAPVALYDDDLAVLMYTSGTTGRAKGVALTHGNLWWNAVNVESVVRTAPDDTTLAVAPMFHIGGLNALTLRTLVRGGTVVIHRTFEPKACLTDLVRYQVRSMFAVPAMYAALARDPDFAGADLSALQSAIVAGAPVPPGLIRQYAGHGVLLQQAWGLTETSPFATFLPPELTLDKTGSAGVPMPYTQVRLTDPVSRAEIDGPERRGELCVRGPNVTAGYWNNAAANQAAFDDAGWFHTGDIAHRDKDGYYYVVDRLKEMIISGGENVFPAEVERVLNEHPAVVEVAVIGVPDPKWGETVLAVLTCETGTAPTLEEIRAFAARQLARYKLPTRLLVTDMLPRNAAGKLEKGTLRRWADRQPAAPPDEDEGGGDEDGDAPVKFGVLA